MLHADPLELISIQLSVMQNQIHDLQMVAP